MSIAELSAEVDKPSADIRPLAALPMPALPRLAAEFPRLSRPGAHRASLLRDRERFRVNVPGLPHLMITSSPDDARAVFGDRTQSLSFGELLRRFMPHDAVFGEDAFIFKEGDEHLEERKRALPPLHGEALKGYEETMARVARERIAEWPVGREGRMLTLGYQLSLEVMMAVVFGMSSRERTDRLRPALLHYGHVTQSPGFLGVSGLSVLAGGRIPPYPPLHRAAAAVDAIVLEEIAERRARPSGDAGADCLSMYLAIQEAEGEPQTDEKLAASMRGLMLAGYETTAVTLSWITEFLAHYPEVLAEAHRTVDAGEHAYLDAVILEVMRLRPVVPMTGRLALRDVEVNGVMIPKGGGVILATMALHERADIYPEPMRFDPTRFVGKRPGTSTWLTFGGGAHRCLGASFALFEARVLLRELLQMRTFKPEKGRPVRPRLTHALVLPAFGAKATLVPRAGG